VTAKRDPLSAWPGVADVDPVLGHRSRLGVCVLLSRAERMTFVRLRELLEESDGGLGAHLKRLEDEGYIAGKRGHGDGRPVTWFTLTAPGKAAVRRHVAALTRLLDT
jgi:DNA-binding MarR family transcriptional regulator